MADFNKRSIFGCLLLLLLTGSSWSAPAPVSHVSGGAEHIVILDKTQPVPPKIADVLARLDLHENHVDVRYIFNNSAFIGFVSWPEGNKVQSEVKESNSLIQAASMKSHCLDLLAKMTEVSAVEQAVQVTRSVLADTRPNAPW